MVEIEYMHVCDYAFQGNNGKACLIGIFQNINAPAFPFVLPLMAVAVQLQAAASEPIQLKIELTRPNGEVMVRTEIEVMASPDGRAFVAANMLTTTFQELGRYVVKVSSGARVLASHALGVQKVGGAHEQGGHGPTILH